MNFLHRLSKKSETTSAASEATDEWENIKPSDDFGNQAKIASAEANELLRQRERQERKIISALLHGANALRYPDAAVSEQDRQLVYDALANHTISPQQKSAILSNIVTPVNQSPEKTIDAMQDKHERRILAYLSGTGFDYWQSTSVYDLQNTLARFPTPYELKTTEQAFLENIRNNNPPQKYAEYQQAMDSFKHKLYGKRLEYYDAIESLQSKADQSQAITASRTQVFDSYHQSTKQAETSPTTPTEVRALTAAEKTEILKSSQVEGDSFIYTGQAYQLDTEILKQIGLEPNYHFTIQNASINLSEPYRVGSHTAVTAYVQTEKGTKVCSYYRSNSQGIWRYLPDYVSDANNAQSPINWFGKGYNEESLNLPSETQYALELITSNNPGVDLDPTNAAFCFAGTAKRYNSRHEYSQAMATRTLRGEFYEEVPPQPSYDLGKLSFVKVRPETLDLTGPSAPNFQESQNQFDTQTNLYGQIIVDHFPSVDNSLEYTFNHNSENQAWLSHIEIKDAPISSSGLRTKWVSAGDFGTPLYEYASMSNGYGDESNTRGNYVNMWKNYLRRMPIIQKYLRSQSLDVKS